MAEALSRSEVESLLSALNPGQSKPGRAPSEPAPSLDQPHRSSELARRVVSLFEQFRHSMTSATGQMLPEPVRLKRHMPSRVPFSELRNRLHDDCFLLLVESEQNGGDLLVVLEDRFAVQFVSCMLGQGAQPEQLNDQPNRRSLSPLEQRLLLRWLKESLTTVADPSHWQPVEFEPIHSDRDLEGYHAQSPWWCEVWELKSEHVRGRIELCGAWEFFSTLPATTPNHQEAVIPASSEAPQLAPDSRLSDDPTVENEK